MPFDRKWSGIVGGRLYCDNRRVLIVRSFVTEWGLADRRGDGRLSPVPECLTFGGDDLGKAIELGVDHSWWFMAHGRETAYFFGTLIKIEQTAPTIMDVVPRSPLYLHREFFEFLDRLRRAEAGTVEAAK